MKGLAKVLFLVVGVSLLATAAQAIPLISSVAVSYPVDSAHPTLTISGSGFGRNPAATLGTQKLNLASSTSTQIVASVSSAPGIGPGSYSLTVSFTNTLPAIFVVTVEAAASSDVTALQQQVAALQQQATTSQQQVVLLQAAVSQLQAALAAVSSTTPANLLVLSSSISTNNGLSLTGAQTYLPAACDSMNVGDLYLSVDGYGQGALPADGRTLQIASYTALFSLIGTNFGGDGVTTFKLPDMRPFTLQGLQYSICASGIFPPHL
jgi:hypothetical protein